MQYVNYPVGDMGGGIDRLSAESKVPEGFSEALVNIDPTPEGYLRKRTGYTSTSGWLPIRIASVSGTDTGDELCFFLDVGLDVTTIDLSDVRSSPIIVHGRIVGGTGDFTAGVETHYYASFNPSIRYTFATGTSTHVIQGSTHNLGERLFVGVAEATNQATSSNTPFIPGEAKVTISNDDVTVEYTNSGPPFEGFIYLLSGAPVSGTVYAQEYAGGASSTWTISAATHQLSNSNILPVVYQNIASVWTEILADTSINNAGDVTFTLTSPAQFTATDYLAILRAVSPLQAVTASVPANSTTSVSIPIDTPFLIWACYEDDGTTRTRIVPSSVDIDAANGLVEIDYTNSTASTILFQFYFEYGSLITNKICVTSTAPISSNYESSDVALSLWGLSHGEIYSPLIDEGTPGWVSHIDTYRNLGEERVISGLGGNIFSPTLDTSYLLGSAYPSLRNRVASSVVLGPAFTSVGTRTRGKVSFLGDGEGIARATAINYQSGSGYTRYTLNTPSLSVTGSPLSVTANQEDYLTVAQAANSLHNGSFKIRAVSYGVNTVTIDVENSAVTSNDYDEQDSGAQCGVFSDQIPTTSSNNFIAGDVLLSDAFSAADLYTVLEGTTNVVVADGFVSEKSVAGSLRFCASRTSSVIPLRNALDSAYASDFVRGDVVAYTEISRTPQIKYINALSDTSCTITILDTVATAVMGSSDTNGLFVGQKVLFVRAGKFSGTQVITSIPAIDSFTFSIDLEDNALPVAATLLGKTIELNEELPWQDTVNNSIEIIVPSRWAPIEAPSDSYNATPEVYGRYFDANPYINQAIMRSGMSNGNMYLTNGDDEVYKYDGTNLYRAGLLRWQPQLFMTVDTAAPSKIIVSLPTIPTGSVSAYASNVFTVAIGQESNFSAGQYVVVKESATVLGSVEVSKVWNNGTTSGFVQFSGNITTPGTIGNVSITLNGRYRYYFRLNMVDSNDNIIASAATGADDYILNFTESAAVKIRLVGMPIWDTYDYDRIEVEIYRTRLGVSAPFYRIATLDVPFNTNDGYIDYTDTETDDTLLNFDAVSTALIGQELGTAWSEPLRAKYLTTADNRLVLGNVRDYPKIVTVFRDVGNTTVSNYAGKTLVVRSNSEDTAVTTDNTSRMVFEWVNSGAVTVSGISGTGPNYTVTATGTYTTGNWVYMFHDSTGTNLDFAGWFQITAGGSGSFTIVGRAGLTTSSPVSKLVQASTTSNIPVWLETDNNYGTANGNSTGSTNLTFTALRRLVNAVNSCQRVCQTAGFEPWVIAASGSEFGGDTFVLSRPRSDATLPGIRLPVTAIPGIDFFVNDLLRAANSSVAARIKSLSSRVIVSYQNFPELFDAPAGKASTFTYDVNPSDGQEITGVIPFFGESAFGGASTSAIVVVFKTNSIYILDVTGNTIDDTRIQKVDSRGIGCTAPFSIAPTQNGIMFATGSGIYRLKRDLTVEYIGRRIERLWQEDVANTTTATMTGHYYPISNQYKLSVPTPDAYLDENSDVLVYNTVREYTTDGYRVGSWTQYTAHPATGWTNTVLAAFFGTTAGDVMRVAQVIDEKPYRDNGDAIAAEATLRSLDFGEPSMRKAVGTVMVDYRTVGQSVTDTVLSSSIDNKNQFQDADLATIKEFDTTNDGLGSTGEVKVRTIQYNIDRRKGVYIQLRFTNNGLDSELEIAGVSIRVAGLSDRGILQAAQSAKSTGQ